LPFGNIRYIIPLKDNSYIFLREEHGIPRAYQQAKQSHIGQDAEEINSLIKPTEKARQLKVMLLF